MSWGIFSSHVGVCLEELLCRLACALQAKEEEGELKKFGVEGGGGGGGGGCVHESCLCDQPDSPNKEQHTCL